MREVEVNRTTKKRSVSGEVQERQRAEDATRLRKRPGGVDDRSGRMRLPHRPSRGLLGFDAKPEVGSAESRALLVITLWPTPVARGSGPWCAPSRPLTAVARRSSPPRLGPGLPACRPSLTSGQRSREQALSLCHLPCLCQARKADTIVLSDSDDDAVPGFVDLTGPATGRTFVYDLTEKVFRKEIEGKGHEVTLPLCDVSCEL